jgi:hypothetical protein
MPDVIDILRNLPSAVTPGPAGSDVVAADLARAHHAVARQRRLRMTVAGAAVVAVAAVGVGAAQLGGQPGGQAPVAGGTGETAQSVRLELVAYTGEQPKGFEVSTVPEGWQVVSDDASSFVVAPPGEEISPPGPGRAVSLADRIAVSLQGLSEFGGNQQIKQVDINGEAGQLGFALESEDKLSDTRWLMFPDGAGHSVLVQVPASVKLTDDQIVRFARGITVTDQAQEIGG